MIERRQTSCRRGEQPDPEPQGNKDEDAKSSLLSPRAMVVSRRERRRAVTAGPHIYNNEVRAFSLHYSQIFRSISDDHTIICTLFFLYTAVQICR
jgi:hypothetical protein